ncbi:MAG: 3-deoxy-D-manno-octulosonate cytidylyltransferase [Sphingobacteriales bacterium 12-47-4]|nr:MAG: 3-deoxy-D-manno-octulosonate cytidylyltransferase [Sphingobacteriales bacterium 12-47-4]
MHTNKIIACIPARYAATRFPAKLMQFLGEKTVIRTTYENTVATGLFDEVIVITDSDIIFQEITTHGGKAMMSKKEHESGSDRIAEAVQDMNVDVVVNVQGDEPFVNKDVLEKLVAAFQDPSVKVASVMHPSADAEYLSNPNFAKVVVDKDSNALYFSRALIPFDRQSGLPVTYYKHIGIYAFRKETLLHFTQWPLGKLEQVEKLEQLRYLENGVKIRMVSTEYSGIGIDTPAELEKARELLGK